MRTIKRDGEHEWEVKKSRFRCALERVTDEAAAREAVQRQRKLHHTARHHCSAYIVGNNADVQKSSDDGEPAGTAGMPMLEVLRRNELTNTVAVVSRYFGGVLLGGGGLVRAYGGVVADAIEHVGMAQRRPMRIVSTTVDYALAGKLENSLRSTDHPVLVADVRYGDDVSFELHVEDAAVESFEAWLAETSAGVATITLGSLTYAEIDI